MAGAPVGFRATGCLGILAGQMLITLKQAPHLLLAETDCWRSENSGVERLATVPEVGEQYTVGGRLREDCWALYLPPSAAENGWGEPPETYDAMRVVSCHPIAQVSDHVSTRVRVLEVLSLDDISRRLPPFQPWGEATARALLEQRASALGGGGGSWSTRDEVAEPHWCGRYRHGRLHH